MTTHLAILGSTRGTAMQAIIDAIQDGKLDATIDLVISNKPDAHILERAKMHMIPTSVVQAQKGESREHYDRNLINQLTSQPINLIILIGWMRILSPVFISAFRGNILNVHPSLLPKFAGGMDVDVHKAVIDAGEDESGCTVHLVDETVDGGRILVQKTCSIDVRETAESLKQKVQYLEGETLIEAILFFTKNRLK